MKVPKNYDVVNRGPISYSKGTSSDSYKGIQPSESAISETPGEKASNSPSAHSTNKKQPFGAGGSGYTSKD